MEKIEKIVMDAVRAHQSGDALEAKKLYKIALQCNPNHADASHNLGVLENSLGEKVSAMHLFANALIENTTVQQFWISYLKSLVVNELFEVASDSLKEAIALGHNGPEFELIGQEIEF